MPVASGRHPADDAIVEPYRLVAERIGTVGVYDQCHKASLRLLLSIASDSLAANELRLVEGEEPGRDSDDGAEGGADEKLIGKHVREAGADEGRAREGGADDPDRGAEHPSAEERAEMIAALKQHLLTVRQEHPMLIEAQANEPATN